MRPQLFPGMKFVLLTAKKRWATVYNRAVINRCFDNYSMENPSEQLDGLRESGAFVRRIILEKAKAVTLENAILGGLS